MDNNHIRKSRESSLTPEQKAKVEAIRAKNRTPEARAAEARFARYSTANTARQEPSPPPAMEPRCGTR